MLRFLATNEMAAQNLVFVIVINWAAVLYNLVTLHLLSLVSPHYFCVIANIKSVTLIAVSMYVFSVHVTNMNAIGMIVSICGFCTYTYLRFTDREIRSVDKALPM